MAAVRELHPCNSFSLKGMAYCFDGKGNFTPKAWDLEAWEEQEHDAADLGFSWYHVEVPRSYTSLASAAQYLIRIMCPPLKLQDILALASYGPFCGVVEGAIIFRANSSGRTTSRYTHKLAGRITRNSAITVSLGHIPRLEFSTFSGGSILSDVPRMAKSDRFDVLGPGECVIQEHVLEFYLLRNFSEDVNHSIPARVSSLVVHVMETHIDHLQDILTQLELDLDDSELELDQGGHLVKQQRLVDRLFPSMQLRLQRLLQVLSHGEQILPRLIEKFISQGWSVAEDTPAMHALISRLQKQKENAGFLAARINSLQAGLDTWQSEQINKRLYYLSFLSIIFLPMSIIISVFGMNVGGIPWTEQWMPQPTYGFRNVLFLCGTILLLLFSFFSAGSLYKYLRRMWPSDNLKRFRRRSISWRRKHSSGQHCNDYIHL